MELKDNFTNRYFKPENIKSQLDLINQPTGMDSMADGLIKQGSQPALGKAQRMSNALATGIGNGLKASANDQRQAQIDPLLKMVGQINAQNAYLEAQMQEQEQQRMTMVDFIRNNAGSLEDLGNSSTQNNPKAQRIAKHLAEKLSIATGVDFGNFDYYDIDRREIFFKQPNGSTIGYSVLDPIRPFAAEALGEQAPFILRKLDPYHEEKYKNAEELRQLTIEKERAGIDQTKAHTGLYNAQAGKATQEMNNPPMTETQKTMMQSANKHVGELQQKAINNKVLVETLNEMEGWIKEATDKGQVGSDLDATLKRNYDKYYTGDNEAATLAEMAKQVFFNRIKEAGGSNPSTKEFESVLETIPSIDKNPNAAIKGIERERKNALKQMHRFEQTQKYFYDNNYQVNPYDESFLDNSEQSFNKFSEQYMPQKTITMTSPDGKISREIPLDQVQLWESKGAKRVK